MSESLHQQSLPPTGPEPKIPAPPEQDSAAVGVGGAQRSEPSLSDGSRSGAPPTPTAAPQPLLPDNQDTNVPPDPADDEQADRDAHLERPRRFVANLAGRRPGRTRGRRLVAPAPIAPTRTPLLTAEQRLLLLDTWQRSGLHASQSSALVLEVLRSAIASHGTPEEILTDNGSQYVTWRGKSVFTRELEKRGIKQVVAKPRRPQTLGKIERFWGTLWRECIESAVFVDLGDAQRRIGLFIDHYNFQRCHQGIDGLAPADRFFGAAAEVKRTLQARVAANALELARNGVPKTPFYLTGQVGGKPFSVHAEGERVILTREEGSRQEIDLVPPAPTPAQASAELPTPVCPMGAPRKSAHEAAPPSPPQTANSPPANNRANN